MLWMDGGNNLGMLLASLIGYATSDRLSSGLIVTDDHKLAEIVGDFPRPF